MTFSEQIFYGLFKPKKYKELIELKKSRSVLFVIVLMFVLGIVNFVIPVGAFISGNGGLKEMLGKRIGNVTYQDGVLTDDRKYDTTYDGTVHFMIDTENDEIPEERLTKDGVYFAFGAKQMNLVAVVGKNKATASTYVYSDFVKGYFDNAALVDKIPVIYTCLGLMLIFSCIGYFIKYAFFALILSLFIGGAVNRFELNLSKGEIFMLCFYGEALSMIITNFNSALGLLPEMLVSFVGIFMAFHMLSSALVFMKHGDKI